MTQRACRSCCSKVGVCTAAVLALTAAFGGISFADFDNRPIVVLREDDIRASWRTPLSELGGVSPLEYGKSKQIPITWGVITNFATGWGLTWAQLTDYVSNAGGELASHSVTHENKSSSQGYIDELVNSKAIIEAHTGLPCRTFLQPGPWTGPAYLDHFSKLNNPIGQARQNIYAFSQAYLGAGWHIGDVFYRYGSGADFSLDYPSTKAPQPVLATLDIVSATPGLVYVFTCHGIQPSTGTNNHEIRANVFKAFVDRLAELRDAGIIRLMSMSDAFAATFSADLNRVPDPGFERMSPGPNNPRGPASSWSAGFKLEPGEGRNGTRCAKLPAGGNYLTIFFRLDPGRYLVGWWQRWNRSSMQSCWSSLLLTGPGGIPNRCGFEIHSQSSALASWSEKTALLVVPYGYPKVYWNFTNTGNADLHIDDLSIVSHPIDPLVSASNSSVSVNPNGCVISWDSPNDSGVTSIVVRKSASTFPMTPTGGSPAASIPALPGRRQEASISPINWQSSSQMYLSIFAGKANGDYAPPELAPVWVDKSPPTWPHVSAKWLPDDTVSARWNSSDAESGVYAYRYAVGTRPGSDDVRPWTDTFETSVVLSGLPSRCYLSVKAQNLFGYWSPVKTTALVGPCGMPQALSSPDGTHVVVSGKVTAVFADFYYIGSYLRTQGIRVQGATSAPEGDAVIVSGTMGTVHGERVIVPDP